MDGRRSQGQGTRISSSINETEMTLGPPDPSKEDSYLFGPVITYAYTLSSSHSSTCLANVANAARGAIVCTIANVFNIIQDSTRA